MTPSLRAITPTATPCGARLQFLFDDGTLEEMEIAFADLARVACALLFAFTLAEAGKEAPTEEPLKAFAHGIRTLSRERSVYLAEQLLAIRREVLALPKQESTS